MMLAASVLAVAFPLVLPTQAALSAAQTTSGTCSGCTTISLAYPNAVQSGDALVVMICWSGEVTGESFSDSSTTNVYQEVVSRSNTVECAGAWTRAVESRAIMETVSWTGSVNAFLTVYEVFGSTTIITVLRNSGTGSGTSLSVTPTSDGLPSIEIACYGTSSSVTLTAGPSFTLDGLSATGGCEHATNLSVLTTFPMTSSASVTWVGVGLVILQQSSGTTQCSGVATTTFNCTTGHNTNQVGIGDLLVVSASRTNAGGTWSISDNQSNVWTNEGSVSNTAKAQVWYTVAKAFGYDQVTVNFSDSGPQSVTVSIMDCGPECTNKSVTYSTGVGTGTTFSVASQTMAIGMGFATIAATSNPGTVTSDPSFYPWVATNAGVILIHGFTTRSANSCRGSGTNNVTWAEICVSFAAGIVETLTLDKGTNAAAITPSNHFTLSYKFDGISRSLPIGARTTTWVDDQFDTNSISAVTSSSTSTHEWAIHFSGGLPVPQTWSSDITAQTVTKNYIYYEQYKNTLKITPFSPSTWDAGRTIKIDGVQLGLNTVVATFAPPNGGGFQTASTWTDKGQGVVWEQSTGGVAGQSWVPNPIASSAIASGGGTYNSDYTLVSSGVATTTALSTTTTTALSTTTKTSSTTLTRTSTTTTVLDPGTHQTVTATLVNIETQTKTGTTTVTQKVTSTATQTASRTTTQTATSTVTATENETETSTTSAVSTTTAYVTTTSATTVTSGTTTTSTTTRTDTSAGLPTYIWILAAAAPIVLLLAVYLMRLKGFL